MAEFAFAFAAGVLTAAAPCILPMLPILLGASIGRQCPFRPVFIIAGFILTFSAFALFFSIFPAVLGLSYDTVRKLSVILLGGSGLLLLWPRPYEWSVAKLSPLLNFADDVARHAGSGNTGGLVLGLR